jgi:uncharacterized membrane protein YvlD (DUF360 family)
MYQRLRTWAYRNLITRFLFHFLQNILLWFAVFYILHLIWPDDQEQVFSRTLLRAAFLAIVHTLIRQGVTILEEEEKAGKREG